MKIQRFQTHHGQKKNHQRTRHEALDPSKQPQTQFDIDDQHRQAANESDQHLQWFEWLFWYCALLKLRWMHLQMKKMTKCFHHPCLQLIAN
jgi:hypothetical protein